MRLPAAVVLLVAAATLASASSADAAGGTVSGTVAGALPTAGTGEASVQLFDGDSGQLVTTAAPTKKGAFKVKLAADGAYVLKTSVVTAGKTIATTAAPVSVKKGQKRKGLKLAPKRKKTKKTKKAARAYVQENGAVTPGVTAMTIEPFGDGTGEFSWAGRGLTDLLTTDMVNEKNGPKCKMAVVANSQDRKLIEHELELQKSKYFDPKTRVKRNFIISDLTVTGSVQTLPGGQSASVTVTISDSRTGAVVDTLQTTMTMDGFFDQEEAFAKQLAERVCRRPAAYELTLAVHGDGSFATHNASGNTTSTLTALRSGGAPGEPPSAWSGTQPYAWTDLAFSSRMSDCWYTDPASPPFTWTAQLSATADEQLSVTWDPAGGTTIATATINCTDSEGHVVSVPGQPGPSFIGVTPTTAALPLTGGVISIGGGFTSGGDGWSQSGTLTVKPIWATSAS